MRIDAPTVMARRVEGSTCYEPANDMAKSLARLAARPALTEGDRVLIEEMGFVFEVVGKALPMKLSELTKRQHDAYWRGRTKATEPMHIRDEV